MVNCLVFYNLTEKCFSLNTASLYAAFIDFKATFDSISLAKLWEKLEASLTDQHLLHLIGVLHEGTSLKIRCNSWDHLTSAIGTE